MGGDVPAAAEEVVEVGEYGEDGGEGVGGAEVEVADVAQGDGLFSFSE